MGRYKKGYAGARHSFAKTVLTAFLVPAVVLLLSGALPAAAPPPPPQIMVLDVKDAISPAIASFVTESIDKASQTGKAAVIIRLDTPGGLDTAMRDIVQKEMNAPIPVIVYVFPPGARAASAGAVITLASDVAAMAPGTNIGAAHPVGVGGAGGDEGKGESKTMVEKVTNDAVAYVRSIARERGRSEQWAEDAVRRSVSTPAAEALDLKVVEIVATDMNDLLRQLDGRTVKKGGRTMTLSTKGAVPAVEEMGARYRLLAALSNPNIAYILLLIGMAGIFFELSSPGAILPGVIGGISLILAFYAFQTLPVNYAGFALILLALIMFIAEIKVVSFGMLTVGGIVSMVLGSLILFRNEEIYTQVSLGVIVPVTLLFAGFFAGTVALVVKAHRRRSVSGAQGLVGETGEVYTWGPDGLGKVFCHGEYWNATGPLGLKHGDRVEVEEVRGLTLVVRQAGVQAPDPGAPQ
jgi:membrane-bound serine protease (ClpP class)